LNINIKSLGVLIDELFTTDMKCWFAQETVMKETNIEKVANAAKSAQELNKRRNLLIQAIDKICNSENLSPTEKTY
jgi:hypothetical protein